MRKRYAIEQRIDEDQAKRIMTKIEAGELGKDKDFNSIWVLLAESTRKLANIRRPQVKATLEVYKKASEIPQVTARSFLQELREQSVANEKHSGDEKNATPEPAIGIPSTEKESKPH